MKIKFFLLLSLTIILIPFLLSIIFIKEDKNNIFKIGHNSDLMIKVKRNDGNIINIAFEDYIIGVLAGEVPANFEIEALKAQAVAARSYALKKIEDSPNKKYNIVDNINNQVYLDNNQLKNKWNTNYDKFIKKIKKAVNSTNHEYLDYNGEVAQAFFFSTSVGKTENCEEVFQESLPYLKSVDSKWDKTSSPVFNEIKELNLIDFFKLLNIPYENNLNFEILKTTSTGRIKEIKINNHFFNGNEIAKLLNLKSNFFKLEQINNIIKITTTGFGHGVGMSQYGANGMAKEGYNYKQILNHYYNGTKIKKIKY